MSAGTQALAVFVALRKARADAGLTQEQVAARIGMSRANFARMENGHHPPMSPRLFEWAEEV